MENVFQELDAVVKDESAPLPFAISPQKVEFVAKKPMINQQVSLASQVPKSLKVDNVQHVPEIVELDDFKVEETKVAQRQPLKCFKKTLLLPNASEEDNKQGIEIHEEDSQTSPKKNHGRSLGSKNKKKIQQQVMLLRNAMCLQIREKLFEQHTRTFCV